MPEEAAGNRRNRNRKEFRKKHRLSFGERGDRAEDMEAGRKAGQEIKRNIRDRAGSRDISRNVKPDYEDMLDLPHHVSSRHPQMSMIDRAAQFSPFAALTGYGDAVREKARLTEQKPELSEEERAELDYKLQMACGFPSGKPQLRITYFVPDQKKAGGAYREINGKIRKIDSSGQKIILEDGTQIPVDCVLDIDILE